MIALASRNAMFELRLHDSLWRGLSSASGLGGYVELSAEEAEALDEWADNDSGNPEGQKADLARAVAGLIRVAGTVAVVRHGEARPQGGRDIWETSR